MERVIQCFHPEYVLPPAPREHEPWRTRGLTPERRERRRMVDWERGYRPWCPCSVLCFVFYRDGCPCCCPNPTAWEDCCCCCRDDCCDGWIVPYYLHRDECCCTKRRCVKSAPSTRGEFDENLTASAADPALMNREAEMYKGWALRNGAAEQT